MNAPMFERSPEMKMILGSVSPQHSNLSVCYLEARNITYAAVAHRSQVHLVNYDTKGEFVNWETVTVCDPNSDRPIHVTQAMLVIPSIRALPLLVVATTQGAHVYDVRNLRLLIQSNIEMRYEEDELIEVIWYKFCRGITCNDNTILVGNHQGDIMQFVCQGESSIQQKKPLLEHTYAIVDLATCKYDEITCSADVHGDIVVWGKPMKAVQLRIETGQTITAINVLRKQVIVGTTKGQLLFYSLSSGDHMATVCAHARPITSVAVAPESAYVMSGSEDGRFIVYKLHTRKPNAFQVEYRYSDEIANSSVAGCQFTNGRGSSIAIACYDKPVLFMYKIVKKPVV